MRHHSQVLLTFLRAGFSLSGLGSGGLDIVSLPELLSQWPLCSSAPIPPTFGPGPGKTRGLNHSPE